MEFWLAKDVAIFEFVWQNRGLMRLLFEGGGGASYRTPGRRLRRSLRLQRVDMLKRGIAHGFYRADLDVDLASAYISGVYDRYARRLVRSAKRPDLVRALRGAPADDPVRGGAASRDGGARHVTRRP